MSNKIITISREFGSGGRTIGKEVAAKLGIPCYDSELLEKIAEVENIQISDEKLDEEIAQMAEMYKMEVEKLKEVLGDAEKNR